MSQSHSDNPSKGIALNPISQSQFLDHLAPASILLGIPHLFFEFSEEERARHYYPGLKTLLLPFEEFSPEWVIANFDYSVLSDQWHRNTFKKKYELLSMKYGKKLRNVHCPHGFSDKGFYLKECAFEDICMVYGQHMLDLFDHWGVKEQLKDYLIVGNYRYSYWRAHKDFYQELLALEFAGKLDPNKKTILYAPTCIDREHSTTFFEVSETLFKELPSDYNLIVKPHPRLEHDDPASYHSLVLRYESKPNILILTDFPLIYPLLSIVDLYLGDMSSIGYDFLAFDKPLIFLNSLRKQAYLHQCGVVLPPEEYGQIFHVIDQSLEQEQASLSEKRKEVYDYTFGKEVPFQEVRKALESLISSN